MTPDRTDCLVIGAGAAGAVYAVQAARAGLHVTLITGARELHASNSLWAQGGIIYDIHDHGDGDLLRADIDAASGHSANPAAVDAIVRDGPRLVRELLIDDLQVAFDRDDGGALRFTREASHSRHRIIYAKDHTGRAILTALHRRLAELADGGTLPGGGSLTVATGCFAVDLLTLSHSSVDFLDRYRPLSCIGAHVLDVAAGEVRPIMAKKTVLATGGLGQLYLHSTNDAGAYGHGVAMAYRVGARVIDMEYVQFHPTVFHRRGERPFLISEAVRGEGGVLINQRGDAFMERYHRDGSLAPRDVISRSIHSELLRGASDTVYIDLSGVDADYGPPFPPLPDRRTRPRTCPPAWRTGGRPRPRPGRKSSPGSRCPPPELPAARSCATRRPGSHRPAGSLGPGARCACSESRRRRRRTDPPAAPPARRRPPAPSVRPHPGRGRWRVRSTWP